ncbi:Unknown protein [Striga hermonthica]|uniref:Uncharacterized protein n=1 Tax=Striga hermonthica TaxID=68872 RepID=A0A9N7RJ85_STRHE|nr:Unknown protein [Striga hermonthica]
MSSARSPPPPLPPPPLTPKRIRLDQSWSSSVYPFRTKVCLAFRCSGYDKPEKYFIEILDLDLLKDKDADIISAGAGEEFKPIKPTFCLFRECFLADTSCVVGSTLFLFDGISGGVYSRSQAHRSSVAAVNLPQYTDDDFTVDLKPPALKIAPHVLHPKCFPKAIPTSDGKILVFSRLIELDHNAVNVDFELFDPITCRSCRELPQLGLNAKSGSTPMILNVAYVVGLSFSIRLLGLDIGLLPPLTMLQPDAPVQIYGESATLELWFCGAAPPLFLDGICGDVLLWGVVVDFRRGRVRWCCGKGLGAAPASLGFWPE